MGVDGRRDCTFASGRADENGHAFLPQVKLAQQKQAANSESINRCCEPLL